jgi:hypothetical protein
MTHDGSVTKFVLDTADNEHRRSAISAFRSFAIALVSPWLQ